MRNKSNEYTLNEAINKLMNSSKLGNKLHEVQLINAWEKLMGPGITKHTKNIYINKKRLFITLDSAPLKQELSYSKSKIIQLLNEEVGKEVIEEVIIY